MSSHRSKNSPSSVSSRSSRRSNESHDSQSTAPTSTHHSLDPSRRISLAAQPRQYSYDADLSPTSSIPPRSSVETYASTVASLHEVFEEPEEIDDEYVVPEYIQENSTPNVRPSTAQDFANYFPTTNRLFIRHDDSTPDGNMNLRVDAEVGSKHSKELVQLFHMRMHDLKTRESSLRRYCRDSGREVCHSNRKFVKPASEGRPSLQRSMSSALASIRGKPDFKRTNSGPSAISELKRKDSGYASCEDEDKDEVASFMSSSSTGKPKDQALETNVTKLEFSNYAHVDVKGGSKKYEFEYWGTNYAWKRISEKDGHFKSISYHLVKENSSSVIARIVPELRSTSQIKAEIEAGGWVPPCSMWICDKNVVGGSTGSDVAE